MDKMKRIIAIICAVILAGIYIVTFVMAILDDPATMTMFKGCIALTIFVPLMAYVFICLHRYAMTRSKRKDYYSGGSSKNGSASSDDVSE